MSICHLSREFRRSQRGFVPNLGSDGWGSGSDVAYPIGQALGHRHQPAVSKPRLRSYVGQERYATGRIALRGTPINDEYGVGVA